MNIAALFIRRPVMTTLVMLAILLFGIVGFRLLPVSDLPNVDFPTLLVSAMLPGASPETMASSVATPLERQFSTIAGLNSMTSTSALGNTQITLQFDLSRNIDAAAQDVQSAITKAASQLPPEMPTPPSYQKVNPAEQAVIYLALSSATQPLSVVDEYAETMMAQRISMVSGVAQVLVYGSQKYAVRVRLNPDAMASRGIGIDEVADAIQRANVNLPTGILWGPHQALTVRASGQLTNAAAYRPIIVAYRNGSPVRLNDLGQVIDSVQNDKTAGWLNFTRSVVLGIQRQPGTNTVEVVDAIKRLMPQFQAVLPASVRLSVIYDRSQTIRASVQDVEFTLLLTIGLVVLVIFLFLRTIPATVIPSLALPMSIVGTFAVMYLLDYSLDNLSLMALTLSVGFLVDDAIVMLENIVRHIEGGERPYEAAINGAKEIGFTILSMTLSLAAVFIPVLFMGGIIGRLLHEFSVTIVTAILVSGFVSLTLTPMLCSRLLLAREREHHGRVYMATEHAFNVIVRAYDSSLKAVLRHPRMTMAGSLVILAVTGCLFAAIPHGFLPSEDTNQIFIYTEAQQGISYDAMVLHQKELATVIAKDREVLEFMSFVGAIGPSASTNTGIIFIHLKPRSERMLGVDAIIQRLRPKLATVTGINAYLQNPPMIRIGGQLTKSLYQLTLQSPDTNELFHYAPILEARMARVPQLRDVTSDLQIKNPQVTVEIDRDKALSLGVSARQIEEALYTAYGTREVSTIYAPNNEYKVITEFEPRYQMHPSAMPLLYIRSSHGQLVPLDTVAKLTNTVGPLTINHLGQLPGVTISFNLAPGVSLGDAVAEIHKLASATLPASVTTAFQGTAQAFEASTRNLGLLLVVTILVIYIVLGILYESFIHPLTILSGLPPAGFGALVALMLFRMELNLYTFVGVIMLVGIVKKNAIMMIDFALDAQRNEGKSPADAIYEGCLVRFRPIMMTTMAALFGTLPIAIGFGAGAAARRPLGIAVVGGLLFSQLITLYITPVYYTYLDSFERWLTSRLRRRDAADGYISETGSGR